MGFLPKFLTPPKSIRKFQLKKLGNKDWWKDFAGEVALPAAGALTGLGALGIGPGLGGIASKLGLGAGSKIGGLIGKGKGLIGKAGQAASALGLSGGGGNALEMALGGADAILNARRGAESDKLRDLGVSQQKLQNKNRADLLSRALALDPNAKGPDLSATFADPSNPFAAQGAPPGAAPPAALPGIPAQPTSLPTTLPTATPQLPGPLKKKRSALLGRALKGDRLRRT